MANRPVHAEHRVVSNSTAPNPSRLVAWVSTVSVSDDGRPKNRLVTIGDSLTHGFMSAAIFRTDLSWPAIVAYELGLVWRPGRGGTGDRVQVPLPGLRASDGPGRSAVRSRAGGSAFAASGSAPSSTGTSACRRRVDAEYMDEVEDYWERGDGQSPATSPRITTWRSTAGMCSTPSS